MITSPVGQQRTGSNNSSSSGPQLSVSGLPAGWYALEFSGGTFPTYFEVAFKAPDIDHHTVYLPLTLKQ